MMNRGPGGPRIFDEDELLPHLTSLEALCELRDALIDNGEPQPTSDRIIGWLIAKSQGSSEPPRRTVSYYRAALARLPAGVFVPSPSDGRRKRAAIGGGRAKRPERGLAEVGLLAGVGAVAAGTAAAAALSPSPALRLLAAPIILVMSSRPL